MKRSRSINLSAMRKTTALLPPVRPLALAIAATTLVACSSREPATVFQSVAECVKAQITTPEECQNAYDAALAEAQKSGPKFASMNDCQEDFGAGRCTTYRGDNGQSWFMPLMAGYMIGQVVNDLSNGMNRYNSAPLYTSYSHRSPFFGQWSGLDGNTYGSVRDRKLNVTKKSFDPKPAVQKTINRGGFGSKVAAKSNWGGGKSSGGWGG